ncbi:peptide ABC transporter permease [Spirochaetia bacterium]|nr:peptide ABC transporter permease [Spirochaetia bacterium]
MRQDRKNVRKRQMKEFWHVFRKNHLAMVGLSIFICLLLMAVFADVIANYDMRVIHQSRSERLKLPSQEHWFGTDSVGRDVFARLVHGSRVSLSIGFSTTCLSLILGGILGSVTGFYGGGLDHFVMRVIDVVVSIPSMLLNIAIVAAMGPSVRNLVMAMTIAEIPRFTRITRSMVISSAEDEYVEAARVGGATNKRIIMRHILPNIIGPVVVQATISVARIILTAAGLSFIGLGVQPPMPEWGAMLSDAREFMMTNPYLIISPGVFIALSVFSFNTIGDGLRDALDPRMRQ